MPAPLITYLSYLAQAGKTFRYTETGPVGLVGSKEVALLNARGGVYSNEEMAALEMAANLVRTTMAFWGITQPVEVIIEGHNAAPDQADAIISEGLENVKKAAVAF